MTDEAVPAVRRRRRAALGASGLAHFLHDGLTDTIYVLLPLWAEAFGLSHAQVGLLKASFSTALATFQIPAGLIAERFGERGLISLGTILAAAGYILLGFSWGFMALMAALLVIGMGSSVQHPLASAVVSKAYSGGPRRAALGTYNFTGDLGKVVFPAAIGSAAVAIGWRDSVILYGILGVLAGLALYFICRGLGVGAREDPTQGNTSSSDLPTTAPRGWGIKQPVGFAALSLVGVLDSMTRTVFLTFMPFLLLEKGAAPAILGIALGLTFAGGATGKLLCGLLAERIGIIRTVVLTEIMTGVGIVLLVALPYGAALALLPVIGLALNGTSSVLYGTVGDFVDPQRQARAFGLFYTLGIGAGAFAPTLFGLVSDRWSVESALILVGMLAVSIILPCLVLKKAMAKDQ